PVRARRKRPSARERPDEAAPDTTTTSPASAIAAERSRLIAPSPRRPDPSRRRGVGSSVGSPSDAATRSPSSLFPLRATPSRYGLGPPPGPRARDDRAPFTAGR